MGNPMFCPLCNGEGTVSLEVSEALKIGRALAAVNKRDYDEMAERLSAIIGDQVADVLKNYHVVLTLNTELQP